MDKFEKWFEVINEELNAEPTVSQDLTISQDINVETGNRTDMISDIDHIMTSLETLASELSEELSLNEDLLDTGAAAGIAGLAGLGLAAKRFYDRKFVAPKARKAQAKVNAMNLKVSGIAAKLSSVEDSKKKSKITAKVEAAKAQASELQSEIDSKYEKASSPVKKALAAEKKAGKMEVLKVTLGEASPAQQKEIKNQLSKLKQQVAKDEADLIDLKPEEGEEEVNQALDKAKKDKSKGKEDTKEEPTKPEDNGDDAEAKKDAELEAASAKVEDAKKAYDKVKDGDSELAKLKADIKFKQAQQGKAKLEGNKELVQGLGDDIGELMKKIEAIQNPTKTSKPENKEKSQKESLIYRALKIGNDLLAEEIAGKSSWQLHNTTLYTKYNSIITKLESDQMISEGLSIKDKFSKLI